VFTESIGTWWNPGHHILRAELAEMVFEPRVGGHIIDRGTDGSECRWSRVLASDPPAPGLFHLGHQSERRSPPNADGGSGFGRAPSAGYAACTVGRQKGDPARSAADLAC